MRRNPAVTLPAKGARRTVLLITENSDFDSRIRNALGSDPALHLVSVGEIEAGIEFIEATRSKGLATLDSVILWCGGDIAAQIPNIRRARSAALGLCPLIVAVTHVPDRLILPLIATGVEGLLAAASTDRALELTFRSVEEGLAALPGELHRRAARLILDSHQERDRKGALSPRERDVATQIILGKSNRNIAETLNISEGTVKSHLRSIFKKTNTRNRTQAALHALRQGRTER